MATILNPSSDRSQPLIARVCWLRTRRRGSIKMEYARASRNKMVPTRNVLNIHFILFFIWVFPAKTQKCKEIALRKILAPSFIDERDSVRMRFNLLGKPRFHPSVDDYRSGVRNVIVPEI